ncbi:MAG: hypothetical protein J6Z45_07400 [Oscillospiraceae bacterium]|nr:hypothetical protein [Oscillospiraceae bacterium]
MSDREFRWVRGANGRKEETGGAAAGFFLFHPALPALCNMPNAIQKFRTKKRLQSSRLLWYNNYVRAVCTAEDAAQYLRPHRGKPAEISIKERLP